MPKFLVVFIYNWATKINFLTATDESSSVRNHFEFRTLQVMKE